MRKLLAAAACLALLSGCGANFTTAYRTFQPVEGGPNSALIDAKQRALFVAPGITNSAAGEAQRKMLVCAEPSPDALSAISSSLSASFGGLFPSGAEVQAALAAALSETASQLGVRNATIQLLRDGMYRQCEAYMNGLIDKYYYEQIANKYVNAMVALLAIEQLAPVGATTASIHASDNAKVDTGAKVDVKPAAPAAGGPPAAGPPSPTTPTPTPGAPPATQGSAVVTTETGSGSSEANASAAAPVISVNVPAPNQREIPNHVSSAVGAMVTWFLTKDTVDYCLRGLFEAKAGERSFGDPFVEVCSEVIKKQMAQQGEYLAGIAVSANSFTYGTDACAGAIRTFWKPSGVADANRRGKISAAMQKAGVTVEMVDLLSSSELAGDRKKVGKELGLAECNS